jgi:hypothetical protein
MPRWHNLAFALAMVAVVAPAAADDMPTLAPAAQAAILDGATACLGATLDPDPRPTRFADWATATPEQRQDMKTDGTVVTRNNVMIASKPGKDGGCVVMATTDARFDAATFYPALSTLVGATVAGTDKPAPVDLPDGEMLVPVITAQTAAGTPNVILVFANRAGRYGQKGK